MVTGGGSGVGWSKEEKTTPASSEKMQHGGDAAERLNQNRKRFYSDGSDPLAFSLFFVAYLPPPAIPPPPRKGGKTTTGNSDGGGGHPLLHLYGEQKRRCSHVANLSPQLRYDFHLRST
ncbi:hypothetical protein CULT_2070004 [[Clostridium] ultunense Esp]|nr:hypothetical protein CULT_2070004 [[Clostridium] ultunense Esp]